MTNPIAFAIPLFFAGIGLELAVARRRGVLVYRFADAITDLSCGIGNQVTRLALGLVLLGAYDFVHARFALFHFADGSPWTWLVAFVGVEFLYYWWHRLSHEVNLLWAAHVVHHQSEDYNLAVALRQAWFTGLTAIPFYLPLALLGVPAKALVAALGVNLLYQFWIHTRLVGRLGVAETVLNTPSHHRVHHAINREYLDRNYGGVVIVFDRLFGTFEPERAPCVYGITRPFTSVNPVWANFHYFGDILALVRRARGADKLRVWFSRPGWDPQTRRVSIPEMPATRFAPPPPSSALRAYLAANLALSGFALSLLLLNESTLRPAQLGAAGTVLVLATLAWGGLLERRRWAAPLELSRHAAGLAVLAWIVATP
jgi:sterol desaturase/sphingolipid hydroxylase (fatty acid hydroxylase superfamily)